MITREDKLTGLKAVQLVGYNLMPSDKGQVATHVILITQDEIPILIDASIGEFIGMSKYVVVAPLTKETDPEIFCRTRIGSIDMTYKIKKNIKLPNFHQRDLIARLQAEVDTNRRVETVHRWAKWAMIITSVNFLLNGGLIILNWIQLTNWK